MHENIAKHAFPKAVAMQCCRVLLSSLPAKLRTNIGFFLIFGFLLPVTRYIDYIDKASMQMVIRRRHNDALLKIQSSLNNPTNPESILEVKKNVYLLLSNSFESHQNFNFLIQQYYEKAITKYGAELFFEVCGISHEKPTNAVLALPGVHYEKRYLEGWNKQTGCSNPLTGESGPTHFVVDDVYNELYREDCARKIQRTLCKRVKKAQ